MRLVVIADLHCGHRTGLTPPTYQLREEEGFLGKISEFQKELWNWFFKSIKKYKPIDILVSNGDAIDGKGDKSGGAELLRADRNDQVNIAKYCIESCEAKHIQIINGTPYHTGKEEDWEAVLADKLGCESANHEFIDCEGVHFDFKHKVGSSVIPHGRWTVPRRQALWNILQAEKGIQPNIHYLIRSHVHYYTLSEDSQKTVITTPALQGWTKYGSRECEGTNDIGFLIFDCNKGEASMTREFFDMSKFGAELKTFK